MASRHYCECCECCEYEMTWFDGGTIWLSNELGEGLQVSNKVVGELIHAYFMENY